MLSLCGGGGGGGGGQLTGIFHPIVFVSNLWYPTLCRVWVGVWVLFSCCYYLTMPATGAGGGDGGWGGRCCSLFVYWARRTDDIL